LNNSLHDKVSIIALGVNGPFTLKLEGPEWCYEFLFFFWEWKWSRNWKKKSFLFRCINM